MKKNICKNKTVLLFAVFFLFLIIQNHFLWLFHDDYGYASLSYIPSFIGNRGMNTSITDIFKFLIYHYQNWGGRVLYFFVEIILLRLGLPFYRIFQSIVTFGIFLLIYKIISKKCNCKDFKLALVCILFYGVFEIVVMRGGIFWITASVLYFIPLFPLLLFMYLYDGKNKVFLCAILIFLATWSQEQIAVLSLSYIGLYTLYNIIIKKKKNISDFIMCCSSFLAFLILMLSKGSGVRIERYPEFYNSNFFVRTLKNFSNIILNNFGEYTKIFTIIFFLCALYLIYKNKRHIKNKYIYYMSFISTYIIVILNIFLNKGYFSSIYYYKDISMYRLIVLVIFFIQILIVFINILYYFYREGKHFYIHIFISAILSQLTMLVAPYFPIRSVTMFEVMCFIIFAYVFVDLLKNKKMNIYIIMIPFIVICSLNLLKITYGYYSNNDEKKYNDIVLKNTSSRIKNGENIDHVDLKKLQNPLYGIEEPYTDGFDYIAYYMKYYYGLPEKIEFIYE